MKMILLVFLASIALQSVTKPLSDIVLPSSISPLSTIFHTHEFSKLDKNQFNLSVGKTKTALPTVRDFKNLDILPLPILLFNLGYGITDRISIHIGTSWLVNTSNIHDISEYVLKTLFSLSENLSIEGQYQWLGDSFFKMKEGQWGAVAHLFVSLALTGKEMQEHQKSKWKTFSHFPKLRRIFRRAFLSNTFGYMATDELALYGGTQLFATNDSLLYFKEPLEEKIPKFVYSDSLGFEIFSGLQVKLNILENHKLTYTFELGLMKTTYIKEKSHQESPSLWIPKVSNSFCFYF